jgi:hypothetical protein
VHVDLTLLAQFVDLLKTGGPWTLLAVMIVMYVRKDAELRRLYLRVIDMATVQAGISAKTEMTISSLTGTLSTALEKWRE